MKRRQAPVPRCGTRVAARKPQHRQGNRSVGLKLYNAGPVLRASGVAVEADGIADDGVEAQLDRLEVSEGVQGFTGREAGHLGEDPVNADLDGQGEEVPSARLVPPWIVVDAGPVDVAPPTSRKNAC